MKTFPLSKTLTTIVVVLLACLAGEIMLRGSGFFPTPSITERLLMLIMILVLISHRISYYAILLPITIGYALYTPIGLSFGEPSYQYIASLFATDLLEGREFLSQLPLLNYASALGLLFVVIFCQKLTAWQKLDFLHSRIFTIIAFLCLLFNLPPFRFFNVFVNESLKVQQELRALNQSTQLESLWGQSTLAHSHYDDYVLIIGESARKDYHHAYGYPVENTPFMSTANGTLIDGFTAGGTNTIASLKLLLTKPNVQTWEGNYQFSLVDLAKSAKYQTAWISNQGYLGQFDTPISSLANRSDEKIFLKSGDSFSQNLSDFALLPKFEQLIKRPTHGKRFIVLHLYGSHPITCDRLTDFPKLFDEQLIEPKYHNVNCYLSSIKKTDTLLEKVYRTLQANQQHTGRTFSMIYFADHGLIHSEDDKGIHILNTAKSKLHYDVPLFKIDSDSNERHHYKVFKSGLNFTDGIGKWLGITNPHLNPNVDLFSNQNDTDDYGLSDYINRIENEPDPAVVIPTK